MLKKRKRYVFLFIFIFTAYAEHEEDFLRAIQKNNKEHIVKLLMDDTLNVNFQDRLGNTGLHYAALNHNFEVMSLLIQHKNIKVNVQNNNKETPLHFAARGLPECSELLLQHGADPDIKDNLDHIPEKNAFYLFSRFPFEQFRKK